MARKKEERLSRNEFWALEMSVAVVVVLGDGWKHMD